MVFLAAEKICVTSSTSMGNEISADGGGFVDAVFQWNDIRSAGTGQQQPTTAFISVDNSAEIPAKRGGEPLRVKISARSVISMRVISVQSGGTMGTCYVPVERIREKKMGSIAV